MRALVLVMLCFFHIVPKNRAARAERHIVPMGLSQLEVAS